MLGLGSPEALAHPFRWVVVAQTQMQDQMRTQRCSSCGVTVVFFFKDEKTCVSFEHPGTYEVYRVGKLGVVRRRLPSHTEDVVAQ